jgi:hypothetical protein
VKLSSGDPERRTGRASAPVAASADYGPALPSRALHEDTFRWVDGVDWQAPVVLQTELRIERVATADRPEGVEMRFRLPLSKRTLRQLGRLGLYTGSSDRITPPGRDRRNVGMVNLYCPRCLWQDSVPRGMKAKHYPKCPWHKISKKR